MIWARPLSSDSALSLWNRSGLTPEGVGLLRSTVEATALVTGLDEDTRELLAELVGSAWVGGAGDAAIIRYSQQALEAWAARLRPGLSEPVGPGLSELVEDGPAKLNRALSRLIARPTPHTTIAGQIWSWGERTRIMGIVNVTPDSFSDGGQHGTASIAISHALSLLNAGADLVDIGGESTRPGAAEVSESDELARVLPVIEGLRAQRPDAVISVDTRKANVAKAALKAGAHLVNDVSGLRDDAMLEVIAEANACACVMHMLGTPETMQLEPRYDDVGAEILDALELALRRAEARGLSRGQLWVDAGIGFGKTHAHNLFLLQRAGDLRLLGAPVLIGASRKGFLGPITGGKPAAQRVTASAAIAGILAAEGAADLVRVHDVAETKDAVAVGDALRIARDGGAKFST